jgi:hypothetical protein
MTRTLSQLGSRVFLIGGLALAGVGCADTDGAAGASCTVVEANGVKTLSCPDGTSATVGAGAPGASGADALVTVTAVAASAEGDCPAGGVRIDSGRDNGAGALGGSGVLDPEEVASSRTLCHGAPGAGSGPATLVATREEPPGERCLTGGTRIDTGTDESGDGALQDDELTSTQYACNGAQGGSGEAGQPGEAGEAGEAGVTGPQGPQGSAGQSVVGSSEPPGSNCADGGVKLVSAGGTTYVCNGSAGTAGLQGPQGEPGPEGPKGDSGPQGPEGPAPGTYAFCNGGPVRADGTTTYPCGVKGTPTLRTYVCALPADTGIQWINAYGFKSGVGTGYMEAMAYNTSYSNGALYCPFGNCTWQNSKALGDGNVSLALLNIPMDSSRPTQLAFALIAPSGDMRFYGFEVMTEFGKFLRIPASSCSLQN